MLKKRYSFIIIAFITIFTMMVYKVYGDNGDVDVAFDFLKSYGWEVSEIPTDVTEVNIPREFDKVYKNYNKIQIKSQLDLMPYRGMSGKRYTFIVKNYPIDVGETVYANVIIINSKPVAGDIMTVSLQGFMHGLGEVGP